MLPVAKIANVIYNLELETVKTTKKTEYYNLACGFDIETTSQTVNGEKAANMYIWALGLGQGEPVLYGRTWSEFTAVCDYLETALGLHEKKLLVIYVHNLAYEFQFMRKHFDWLNVFALSERKPIKAICSQGIEFRCSLILSGFSLENTAKNLTKYKTAKLVGDLDYNLPRHHKTPLTDKEMGYVKNDIEVITAYIQEQIELYGDVTRIPLTNTGRVRKHVREECYNDTDGNKRDKSKYLKFRKIINDLTLTTETYQQQTRAFMGGFTHANANYSGRTLNNVSSVDFTSSYPSVMVAEKFPMSKFLPVKIMSMEHFDIARANRALIFDITFTNLRCKITQETYLSEHKCQTINAVVNNGRVFSADSVITTLTEIDFEIMSQTYEWDYFSLANVHQAYKNYLPYSIIKSILDMYQDKTVLKDVEGSEVEYMLSKGMLNSVYGMSVTSVVKDDAIYTDSWDVEPANTAEEIATYNESRNRFLYYPWGLWVTAYARRNLWTGILAVGSDYVYSDTDSMKILNYEKHAEYFKWFDADIIQKMEKMCDFYDFDKKLLSPKTKEGIVKTLGIWDYEGTYSHFKTLGAKRYLTLEGERLTLTLAGLGKTSGVNYLLELANGDKVETFNHFNDNLYIPAHKTGKMTHSYIDEELKYKVTDHLGNVATVNPLSSIHLENCDFTVSIAPAYKNFLATLTNGQTLKGTVKA